MRKLRMIPTTDDSLHVLSTDELNSHSSAISASLFEGFTQSHNFISIASPNGCFFQSMTLNEALSAIPPLAKLFSVTSAWSIPSHPSSLPEFRPIALFCFLSKVRTSPQSSTSSHTIKQSSFSKVLTSSILSKWALGNIIAYDRRY